MLWLPCFTTSTTNMFYWIQMRAETLTVDRGLLNWEKRNEDSSGQAVLGRFFFSLLFFHFSCIQFLWACYPCGFPLLVNRCEKNMIISCCCPSIFKVGSVFFLTLSSLFGFFSPQLQSVVIWVTLLQPFRQLESVWLFLSDLSSTRCQSCSSLHVFCCCCHCFWFLLKNTWTDLSWPINHATKLERWHFFTSDYQFALDLSEWWILH